MAKERFEGFIVAVLVANSAHVPPSDRVALRDGGHIHGSFAVLSGPDGMLVYVPSDQPPPSEAGAGLAGILRIAHQRGARYILFDHQAERLPGMRTYAD